MKHGCLRVYDDERRTLRGGKSSGGTIVRLEPGDYPFVTAPTVIDLTRPEIEQLSAIVSAPSYKFVVQLAPSHVKAIDDAAAHRP